MLVVGAGPGGLAAAATAARRGARVCVVDMQPRAGGQVWRHDVSHAPSRDARRALTEVSSRIVHHFGSQVIEARADALLVEHAQGALEARFDKLVLATGARELLLPFPGWTLPGVAGAGGLQALAKQGTPMVGRRVALAGSGPLLLAAAATLVRHGAQVIGLFEQAPADRVMAFARGLWRWPARALQALQLRRQLIGVPFHYGHVVTAAEGTQRLQSIETHDANGVSHRVACDAVGVGYGLVPNTELAARLGCVLDAYGAHTRVRVDALQRTNHAHIFAVGETCGIGGLSAARLEGAIAAHVALGHDREATRLWAARDRARAFAKQLADTFALDPRVLRLATPETLICRCEDVPLSAITPFNDSRDARLVTRCGMGACQGRICGTALAELGLFGRPDPRPPLFPARLATLATADTSFS